MGRPAAQLHLPLTALLPCCQPGPPWRSFHSFTALHFWGHALSLQDASQGEGGSGQPQLPQDALLPAREPVLGCLTPAAIPYILAMTDCCMGLAS
eukprot:scaffold11725_cov19-Tisochrysis_lutea.AAC.2